MLEDVEVLDDGVEDVDELLSVEVGVLVAVEVLEEVLVDVDVDVDEVVSRG